MLDPDAIATLYRTLGSYGAVVKHLTDNGILSPVTGEPYGKSAIYKAALKSARHLSDMAEKGEAAAETAAKILVLAAEAETEEALAKINAQTCKELEEARAES